MDSTTISTTDVHTRLLSVETADCDTVSWQLLLHLFMERRFLKFTWGQFPMPRLTHHQSLPSPSTAWHIHTATAINVTCTHRRSTHTGYYHNYTWCYWHYTVNLSSNNLCWIWFNTQQHTISQIELWLHKAEEHSNSGRAYVESKLELFNISESGITLCFHVLNGWRVRRHTLFSLLQPLTKINALLLLHTYTHSSWEMAQDAIHSVHRLPAIK